MARYFAGPTVGTLLVLACATALAAQEERPTLLDLSLEELIDVEVMSVSMKEERWFAAPAAVHVITAEDIRRSGVTSLAEALRLVPGMQVARYSSSEWAISSRGFNDLWSNKLLVLIDGRSIYNPLFAGVQWDIQDLVLEDIARIEVIRGPGATLWGANAVNGVINIVTQSSSETQGSLVSAALGTEDRVIGTVRHGVTLRPGLTARGFAKYTLRDRLTDPLGPPATGEWDVARVGGRVDWRPSDRSQLMLDGAAFDGGVPQLLSTALPAPPYQALLDSVSTMSGGWVTGRWEHRISQHSDVTVQAYFDRTARTSAIMRDVQDAMNLEARHRFAVGRNTVVWGVGYRRIHNAFTGSFALAFDPSRRDDVWSLFVQNELTLVPNHVTLTAGTKLEQNDYSGLEIQPSTRLLWTPHPRHSVWASASRAVRTPSQSDQNVRFTIAVFPDTTGLVNHVHVLGTPDFESEKVVALEAGYRIRPVRQLWFDFAVFYNMYDDVRTAVLAQPFMETNSGTPYLVIPRAIVNGAEGTTRGAEVLVHVQPTARWKLTGSYSTIAMNIRDKDPALPSNVADVHGDTPSHQALLRSELNLPRGLELDASLFAVDELTTKQVPGYTRFDVRLGWQVYSGLNLSFAIQNALEERHAEYGATEGSLHAAVERSVVGKLTWRF